MKIIGNFQNLKEASSAKSSNKKRWSTHSIKIIKLKTSFFVVELGFFENLKNRIYNTVSFLKKRDCNQYIRREIEVLAPTTTETTPVQEIAKKMLPIQSSSQIKRPVYTIPSIDLPQDPARAKELFNRLSNRQQLSELSGLYPHILDPDFLEGSHPSKEATSLRLKQLLLTFGIEGTVTGRVGEETVSIEHDASEEMMPLTFTSDLLSWIDMGNADSNVKEIYDSLKKGLSSDHAPQFEQMSDEQATKLAASLEKDPDKPHALFSGSLHHATWTVLYGNGTVIHIDSDNNKRTSWDKNQAITVYQTKKPITQDLLKKFKALDSRGETGLIEIFELTRVAEIPMKYQKTGTCTSTSFKGVFLSLLVMEQLGRGKQVTQKEIDQACPSAKHIYKEITTFSRVKALNSYLLSLKLKKKPLDSIHGKMLLEIAGKLAIFNRLLPKGMATEFTESINALLPDLQLTTDEQEQIKGLLNCFLKTQDEPVKNPVSVEVEHRVLQQILRSLLRANRPLKEIALIHTKIQKLEIDTTDGSRRGLFYAARFASPDALSFFMNRDKKGVIAVDAEGRTPLHLVCMGRSGKGGKFARDFSPPKMQIEKTIQKIYEANKTIVFTLDKFGKTPIDYLMESEDLPSIKIIGGDFSAFSPTMRGKILALAIAKKDDTLKDKLLAMDTDPTASIGYKPSALALAIDQEDSSLIKTFYKKFHDEEKISQLLLEKCAQKPALAGLLDELRILESIPRIESERCKKLIWDCIFTNNPTFLKKLLPKMPAALPKSDDSGTLNVLHKSVGRGNEEIVFLLAQKWPTLLAAKHFVDGDSAKKRIQDRLSGKKNWDVPSKKTLNWKSIL